MRYEFIAGTVFCLAVGTVNGSETTPVSDASNNTPVAEVGEGVFVARRGGRDLTQEFSQRFCNPVNAPEPARVENVDVLLVHGWLGEVAIKLTHFLDKFNDDQRALDYLKDQRAAASAYGACSTAPAYRSDSVCICGEKLAELIACSPKPLIIISHSKGCLDTLDALLRLQQAGQLSKVAGWIAIQGPFFGSEEAATFIARKNPVGRIRIKLLGANLNGVRDMMPSTREEYMASHQAEIETLVRSIPVLCFASWTTPICEGDMLSDGHVSPDSAILPGSAYIAKCGINHSQTVLTRKDAPFDRVLFTKTLLDMLREISVAPMPKQ